MKTIINAKGLENAERLNKYISMVIRVAQFSIISCAISFTAQAYLFIGIVAVFMIWNTRENAQRVVRIIALLFVVAACFEIGLLYGDTPTVVYFIVAGLLSFVIRYMLPSYWRDVL